MNRLQEKYKKQIVSQLLGDYKNVNQVPKLEKIVLNMGVGEAAQNKTALDGAIKDMTAISGRKPIVSKAKQSISNFKLRAGMPIGCKTTLRAKTMYEFLDRLITVVIPRLRDFRGLSTKSFDGRGNYNMGIREQVVFPEINYDTIDKLRGLNITLVTSANTDEAALKLLTLLGMPFKK